MMNFHQVTTRVIYGKAILILNLPCGPDVFFVKPSGELVHHYLSFVEGVQKVLASYKARLTKYHVMGSAEC